MKNIIRSMMFVAGLLLSNFAIAEPLPTWNFSEICKEDSDQAACKSFEANARGQVEGPWTTLPQEITRTCIKQITSFKQKSYRLLQTCLEEEVFKTHQIAQKKRIAE